MALKGNNTPRFESDDAAFDVPEGLAVSHEDAAAATQEAARNEASAAPAFSGSTEVAVVQTKSLSDVLGSKFKTALVEYENVIDTSQLQFDTFPSVTVGLDGFSMGDDDLGKRIKIRLMSWNKRYIVTAAEDNEEANKLVKFSHDGKVLDDDPSISVAQRVAYLKAEGYDKACMKEYYQLYGFLIAKEKGGQLVDLDIDDQSLVTVQCPPRSIAQFQRYQIEMGIKQASGKVLTAPDELVLTQVKEKGSTKNYAKILFSNK